MQASSVQDVSQNFNFHSLMNHAQNSGNIGEDFMEKLKIEDNDDVEEEDNDEFSFPSPTCNGSPIAAEDAFTNGQIRPIFPVFNQDLLFDGDDSESSSRGSLSLRPPIKKLFVEELVSRTSSDKAELAGVPEGEYCVWSGKAVEASPGFCKKSNSTGSSRVWRFRDLGLRSSSNGKDAFVLFANAVGRDEKKGKTDKEQKEKTDKEQKEKGKAVKGEMATALEKHYGRNREMKEGQKRRSYLPYKPGLVGFFANVNGMSKNIHPF